ncbi:MAG: PilT/PilU family type 4a pilus ATPase [Candidatus Cloacimonetes bacterium]|nr:PilT/PilU family type 4a pilus ATPase [Candidatus Cloacimonadota bacterium]
MASIDRFLQEMVSIGASDLHLHADYPATFRVDGALTKSGKELSNKQVISLLGEILSKQQKQTLNRGCEVDFAYAIDSFGRFRGNVFMQDGKFGGVFRIIPENIKNFEEIQAPFALQGISELNAGLILVTGPTGSGKSTTMAAMIDHINKYQRGHILTLEDPIEFVHPDKKCMVQQKEIGIDIPSFSEGLKIATIENPDVVLIGEIRDEHSMISALNLAESGILVLATLHTMDVANTVKRVVGLFDENNQSMIRSRFAHNIAAVVSMRLLPAVGGGRVPIYEVLISNAASRNLIIEGKDHQMESVLEGAKKEGMQTFAMHARTLLSQRLISQDTASLFIKRKA